MLGKVDKTEELSVHVDLTDSSMLPCVSTVTGTLGFRMRRLQGATGGKFSGRVHVAHV